MLFICFFERSFCAYFLCLLFVLVFWARILGGRQRLIIGRYNRLYATSFLPAKAGQKGYPLQSGAGATVLQLFNNY
jgi:hypothetical protein